MKRLRRWCQISAALGALALVAATAVAQGADLGAFQGKWPQLGLHASLSEPTTPEVEQGSDLQLRLTSDATASIAIVLEGKAGEARLHTLSRPDSGDELVPGTEMLYPDMGYGETLYADLPVGEATVWVVASDRTLFPPGKDLKEGAPASMSASALAHQIQTAESRGLIHHVTVLRLPIDVVAPNMKEFVTKQDFISFYAVRTRSVRNANRGFRIGFKFNSATLDNWSKRQLEAVGEGMRDAQLASFRFSIEGYTDDVGTEAYNYALSVRRAKAVRDFLSREMGVPEDRLTARGFGDTRPAAPGTSAAARQENRRVVIRRLDPVPPE
jgi:outer membrane protein OmpA-like peptidoglycan-associated protein